MENKKSSPELKPSRSDRVLAGMKSPFIPCEILLAAMAAIFFALPLPCQALTINLVETSTAAAPPNDPTGALLKAMMERAAETWEAIILDNVTLEIEFAYTNSIVDSVPAAIDGDGFAYPWASAAPNGYNAADQTISGFVNVNPFTLPNPTTSNVVPTWVFDTDPTTHENFDMKQALYRDLGTTEAGIRFSTATTTPPDVLEVSYRGEAIAGTPTFNTADAYTTLLHEIGHVLGMHGHFSNAGDTVVTTDPDFTVGTPFDANFNSGSSGIERGHFEWNTPGNPRANNPLMCGSCAELSARRLPTAQDVICIASLGHWTEIDLPRKEFAHPTLKSYNRAGNWIGNRVPDAEDEVSCRHGGVVRLNSASVAKTLTVSSGSQLETQGHDLTAGGAMSLSHPLNLLQNHTLLVEGGSVVAVEDLDVQPSAVVEMTDNSDVVVADDLVLEGRLRGNGKVRASGVFRNNGGTIIAEGGGTLELAGGAAGINLDGENGFETGTVKVESADFRLLSPLTDHFGNTIDVEAGFAAIFEITFSLGTNGVINLNGGSSPDPTGQATIRGRSELLGTVNIDGEAAIRSHNFIGVASSSFPSQLVGHTFEARVDVDLPDANDRLAVYGVEIEDGATFTGAGSLVSGDGAEFDLHDGADVGVKTTNRGFLSIATTSTGDATVAELVCRNPGTMTFDIDGIPATGNFDHLQSTADAQLRGRLVVNMDSGITGLPGMRWRILDAPVINGVFSTVEINNPPAPYIASVEYATDGVDVVLSSGLVLPTVANLLPVSAQAGTGLRIPLGQGGIGNVRISSDNTAVIGALEDGLDFRAPGTANVRVEVLLANGDVDVQTYTITVEGGAGECGIEAQLLHSAGAPDDALGSSSAISGDIAIGGAPEAIGGRGQAVIWERLAAGWTEVATLITAGAPNDSFGAAVALNGNTALVGAPGRATDNGEVRVFERSGGAWSQTSILNPASVAGAQHFGQSLALSSNFAFVGAPTESGSEGAVYVFQRGAGSWTPLAILRASDRAAGMRFGASLAWSGGMLAVGAPGRNADDGAVYRFELAGGALVERQILTAGASLFPGEALGSSVAFDPTSLAIFAGAPLREVNSERNAGGVAVFENTGGWNLQAMVELPSPELNGQFGFAVAVGGCGPLASAPFSNALEIEGGALHMLLTDGAGSWKAAGATGTPDLAAGDHLGYSLGGHAEGFCAGARYDDDRDDDAGAVYVWREGVVSGGQFIAQGDPADWLDVNFPGGAPGGNRLDLDDDGDGRSRLFEYLQGRSPTQPEGDGDTVIETDTDQRARIRFRLARRAKDRYQMRAEWSGDGRFWTEDDKAPEVEDAGDADTVSLLWSADDRGRPGAAIGRVRVRPRITDSAGPES